MIRINLLPFRAARKKENVRRQLTVFCLSMALLVVAVFAVQWWLTNRVSSLDKKLKQTQTELDKYNQINQEIAEIKKKLENLNKKMTVMADLERNRHEPTRLMDAMTQVVVPKRMWFTKLEEKDKTVNMDGIALDNKTVADFMVRLEKCGLFSTVSLRTLKQTVVQNSNLKSFAILCVKKQSNNPSETETKADS
jgi:type IV pilus assembly protein PilN